MHDLRGLSDAEIKRRLAAEIDLCNGDTEPPDGAAALEMLQLWAEMRRRGFRATVRIDLD